MLVAADFVFATSSGCLWCSNWPTQLCHQLRLHIPSQTPWCTHLPSWQVSCSNGTSCQWHAGETVPCWNPDCSDTNPLAVCAEYFCLCLAFSNLCILHPGVKMLIKRSSASTISTDLHSQLLDASTIDWDDEESEIKLTDLEEYMTQNNTNTSINHNTENNTSFPWDISPTTVIRESDCNISKLHEYIGWGYGLPVYFWLSSDPEFIP